jgi:hypothetical protein
VTVCGVGDLLWSHESRAVISGPVPRYRLVIAPLASAAGCGGRVCAASGGLSFHLRGGSEIALDIEGLS